MGTEVTDRITTIRIVIADDHPVARAGFRTLLTTAPDIEVVGEAENGRQAMHMVEELHPDVLVLDMSMPDIEGDEVARRLRAAGLAAPILAFSAYSDDERVFAAVDSGVAGYLLKDEAGEALAAAIRAVARGSRA